ncbi:MAG: ABC transporter substrate-binding protein, partial [Pseudomonadales bacterium]
VILRTASRRVNEDLLSEYTARNNAALRELVDKHGVELRRLPDDVLQALRDISDEMIEEIPGDDALAQRIYQSYKTFRDDVEAYHEISERAYINARAETGN